ncbi:MAG: tannase/feruloyl esterase family alpha/beta hydrolase [Candidatus Acidiferrales bacterium]
MGRRYAYIVVVLVAIALTAIALGATPAAVDMCSRLMHNSSLRALPNTTITSAETVSGTFTPPDGGKPIEGLPSFCRVTATIKPSPASDIKVEVWMPSTGWNGKLEGIGNGGLGGSISYTNLPNYVDHAALEDAIKSGYAGVSTDTGHVASDRTWLTNEDKERDYGYRAIHGMTVDAKAIVQKFYGSAAKRSYFNGCSTGGGQALGEAQLYSEDYDGILAGDSQNILTHTRASDIWLLQAVSSDPASKLSKSALSLITKAVLKLCDPQALADGFLSTDPRECFFGPELLLCKERQDSATCLTSAQAKLVMKIYEGYIIRSTNQRVMPGMVPGSEGPEGPGIVGWDGGRRFLFTGEPDPSTAAAQFYRFGVFQGPNIDLRKADIDSAVVMADKKFGFINHTSTNLDAFVQRGGKLLMYHGWDDGSITPINSINYYSSVVEVVREKLKLKIGDAVKETQKSARLFMVPGMGHCGGGPGPDNFDALGALDQWVDHDVAPEKIIASHVTNGTTSFSRPLCPYPQEAQYVVKSGDRTNASSWACVSVAQARPIELFDHSFYETPQPDTAKGAR